jgi:hypothetical protein
MIQCLLAEENSYIFVLAKIFHQKQANIFLSKTDRMKNNDEKGF